jgi:hypothetical protein
VGVIVLGTPLNDPLKHKSSLGNLLEGARRNRYGEGASLQGHVFGQRVNPIGVRAQGEGFLQIEARRGLP